MEPQSVNMNDIDTQLKNLQKPASLRWVLACLLNWGIIAFALYCAYFFQNLLVDFFVILAIGNRQHALALLGHEGAHYMLSTHRRWNDFLTGFFAFWPLGINLPGYRKFHFLHHLKVGTKADPELLHKNMKFPDYDLPIGRLKMVMFFIKDILCLSVYEVLILISFVIPKRKTDLILPNVFLGSVIALLIFNDLGWVLILWFIANISSFWAFFRIRIYIEHIGTKTTHRIIANPLLIFIFFPYGADTHWEHHQWPTMLYYNRSKARKLVTDVPLISVNALFDSYEKENKPETTSAKVEARLI